MNFCVFVLLASQFLVGFNSLISTVKANLLNPLPSHIPAPSPQSPCRSAPCPSPHLTLPVPISCSFASFVTFPTLFPPPFDVLFPTKLVASGNWSKALGKKRSAVKKHGSAGSPALLKSHFAAEPCARLCWVCRSWRGALPTGDGQIQGAELPWRSSVATNANIGHKNKDKAAPSVLFGLQDFWDWRELLSLEPS